MAKKGDTPPRIQKMDAPIPKQKTLMPSTNNKTGSGIPRERGKSKGKGGK